LYAAAAQDAITAQSPHSPTTAVSIERFTLSPGGGDAGAKRAALEVALGQSVFASGDGDEAPVTPGRTPSRGADADEDGGFGPMLRFECSRLGLPALCLRHLAAVESAMVSGRGLHSSTSQLNLSRV
jgi:hypothetical protein